MSDLPLKHCLIVGLGNPGKKYELTRHNMGYLVVRAFAQLHGWNFKEEKQFDADIAKGQVNEQIVHLLLPKTYMNKSGIAVRRYLDFYKLSVANLVVVVDDVALEYGEMRLRKTGSHGGHNGLKSIEAHLGTREYIRLRMGIGQKVHPETLADYVLDRFSKEELLILAEIVQQGAHILKRLINESITQVMNAINRKKFIRPQIESQEKKHEGN